MQFGAVTFVLAETIFRKSGAEVTHDLVAGHFRDHARRRDRQAKTIAVDDRRLRKRKWKHREAVDQDVFRRRQERDDRQAHGLVRGAQNVEPIDLTMIDDSRCPSHLPVRRKIDIYLFAQLGRELFGIV